jgi:uncharacterized small protein (DUF1192 family)
MFAGAAITGILLRRDVGQNVYGFNAKGQHAAQAAIDRRMTMDWDPPKAKSAKVVTLGEDLSALSVAELDERVAQLQAEIARTDAMAAQKRRHSSAAAELFGKSS